MRGKVEDAGGLPPVKEDGADRATVYPPDFTNCRMLRPWRGAAYLAARRASTISSRSQGRSMSVRPKWP